MLFSLKEEVNVPILIHKGEKNRGKHACIGLWKVKQIAPLLAVFQAQIHVYLIYSIFWMEMKPFITSSHL